MGHAGGIEEDFLSNHDRVDRRKITQLIQGCWTTKVIGEGVRYGVFDGLANGEATAHEIAKANGADAASLHRLMRALTVLDLLRQTGPETFALSEAGAFLRRDDEASLSAMAMHWADRLWRGFSQFDKSIATGEPTIEAGPDHFNEMQNNDPARADVFNRAMAEATLTVGKLVAKAYDFSRFDKVVDVGGGYGALLVGLLEANPQLAGTVFDLAGLAGPGAAYIAEKGLSDRVQFVGGSFFEEAPPTSRCLVLKYIIHDWGDCQSKAILSNCARSIGRDGVILLVERIVPEIVQAGEADMPVIMGDMVMLRVGGKERTLAEYEALFAASGLRLYAVYRTGTEYAVIEAVLA